MFRRNPSLIVDVLEEQEGLKHIFKSNDNVEIEPATRKKGTGRPRGSFKITRQEVINDIRDIIMNNEISADERRRKENSSIAAGLTWKEISSHIRARHGDLSDVSVTTTRRTCAPPNRSVNASSYYRNLIDAKPRSSANSAPLNKVHPNEHSCFANVSSHVCYALIICLIFPLQR